MFRLAEIHRRLAARIATALLACVAAAGVSGQQAQPPTFRAGVLLVPLDVRVVDAQGNPVTDLTAADFTILEDGIPQKIAEFSTRAYTGESTVPRTFAILLGRGNHEPGKGLDAIVDFVRSGVLPADRVTVLAYLRATNPSTNHAAIVRLLERYRTRYQSIEGRLTADARGWQFAPSPETRAAIDALFDDPELTSTQNLPAGAGGSVVHYNSHTYLARGLEYLRRLEGEKHLICLFESRLALGKDGDVYFSRKAAAARVTVSIITTGGGEPAQGMLRGRVMTRHAPSAMEDSMDEKKSTDDKTLAEQTGGLAAFYQDVRKPLDRLTRMNGFEYLLGYYPAVPPAEGEYRQLKIVAVRNGVTVLYRHGYESRRRVDEPLDVRPFFTESRIQQAASSPYGFQGVPIKISASVTNSDPIRVAVDLTIDPKKITFTQSGDQYTAALDVAVYVAEVREKMLAEKRDRIELKVDAAALARVKKELIHRTVTLAVSGKPDQIKVVVYDYDADRLGTASLRITSPRRP
jgi:VWFA-related protein